jgi:hypothetical protein
MGVKGTNRSEIFSIFKDELEKSLNQTRGCYSKKHIMGEAKAPMKNFYERSTTYEEFKQAWENPNLSKSRRIKYL